MTKPALYLCVLMATAICATAGGQQSDAGRPRVYVPYSDIAAVIDPAAKAVLMDRAAFHKLLSAAKANAQAAGSIELGQVTNATYAAEVAGETVSLAGVLTVVSMSEKPVAVPLQFAHIGLTRVALDTRPAPLGYDESGKLILIVTGKGSHKLEVSGTTVLRELAGGGAQFSMVLPEAVAGTMQLAAPGDCEVHATVPVSGRNYDRRADRTTVDLTVGGHATVTTVLTGNGRQEDDRAILIGESATSVNITKSHQIMSCLYTVQVFRRGVRELAFTLPREWTVTDVACPNLVRWTVGSDEGAGQQILTVRLRGVNTGTQTAHIKASAAAGGDQWNSPPVNLVGAAFQRGYLTVDMGEDLRVRGESLMDARREDIYAAPQVLRAAGGRLYFHWGRNWNVKLDMATLALRRSSKERQSLVISPEQLALDSTFEVTAIGQQLFDISFSLPPRELMWSLSSLTVNNSDQGFQYRLTEDAGQRTLKIELAHPIEVEAAANVRIVLQQVPEQWDWQERRAAREISLPLIISQAEATSGLVSISAVGDLVPTLVKIPPIFESVPVGRMASLGLGAQVQLAYTYQSSPQGLVKLSVARDEPRIAAESIGLVTATATKLTGCWRIDYTISRAQTRELYLLVDASLGQTVKIETPDHRLAAKRILPAGLASAPKGYNVWALTLDGNAIGKVSVKVEYECASIGSGELSVPLIRPIAEQTSQLLAVQASEEIAVEIDAIGAKEMDAIELPPLPAEARRLLAAFRLGTSTTSESAQPSIKLRITVHERYEIPTAIARSAELTTYIGADGSQQTEGTFHVAYAGMQFLTIRLPKGAELWSVRVGRRQAKPKRGRSGDYQVALPPSAKPVTVRIVYRFKPDDACLARLELGGVELPGVKLSRARWDVVPPPGYLIVRQQTRMETRDISRPAAAYEQILKAAGGIGHGCIIFPSLSRARELGKRVTTASNLNSVGKAIILYRAENDDRWPDSLDSLVEEGVLSQKGLTDTRGRRFEYFAPPGVEDVPGDTVIAISTMTNGLQHVLWADGHVSSVPPRGGYAADRTAREELARKRREADPQVTETGKAWGFRLERRQAQMASSLKAAGRYTLPVELVRPPGLVPAVSFTTLGQPELTLELASRTHIQAWGWFGFTLIAALGIALAWVKSLNRFKAMLAIGTLAVTSLLALWLPATTYAANGAFYAALCLILLYLLIPPVRWITGRISRVLNTGRSTAAVAAVLVVCLISAAQVRAAEKPADQPAEKPSLLPLIVPYDGDPTKADQSEKVLIPYERFVRLWNQANPDDPIDLPTPGMGVALAAVNYQTSVEDEQVTVVLTAEVQTYGKAPVLLPMPISGLAVTEATFDGKAAKLQAGDKGLVLMLPGNASGKLRLAAVTTPKYLGRKGSVSFSLPPLPAAVMTVRLPATDLVLDAPGVEGALTSRQDASGVIWTVPLGTTHEVKLSWSPKVGEGRADRTLSAAAAHEIYAFHWGLVGVSKISYAFSAGQNDRFGLLLPAELTLTQLDGPNIREHRTVGEKIIDGQKFRVLEVRLSRPAIKRYELTARWLGDLPKLQEEVELLMPQAADVARESGTVLLNAVGGMDIKVTKVIGGRRTSMGGNWARPQLASDSAEAITQHYWPYRPFSIFVELSRFVAQAEANLDQLIRISSDQVQLLVDASLTALRGRLFGASFALPDGYELLSVVGEAVGDWYEQATPTGKRLHVNFRYAVGQTRLALVLVRSDAKLENFEVPTVRMIDPDGQDVPTQKGRLAVQVAGALDAQTVGSENLKPIVPRNTADWLGAQQARAVQFGYRYDRPRISLRLKIGRQPTRVRVESFTGVAIKPTSATYTYRLRYRIEGSPTDSISFTLPNKYAPLVVVNSPAMRSVSQSDAGEGQTRWTVSLVNETTGVLDVTVNFALSIDATTTSLEVPRLVTDAPQGHRAIVAIQNLSRHQLVLAEKTRLAEMPVAQQQGLLSTEVRSSLLYVLQSFTDDWSLRMKLTPAEPAARVQAVIDLMALTTVIDRNGQCRYDIELTLQNRSEQFLRLGVPEGLKLWSARVAGEMVKPAAEAGRNMGEVLIPLVKTSPGGLPYNVKLFLAGKPVAPLDGIVRIRPPNIEILGVPVMRTTWSLRLPAGYRYMRPSGNMSPIAGTAEMMSIGIEARLAQLERLTKTYTGLSGSYRQQNIAGKNWKRFNKRLAGDIAHAKGYVEANRTQLRPDEYLRLRRKLQKQAHYQSNQTATLSAAVKRQREQASNDLNVFLNYDATNRGLSELARNERLASIPKFVQDASERQSRRLEADLKETTVPPESQAGGKPSLGVPIKAVTSADDLLVTVRSEDEARQVLERLRNEQQVQLVDRTKKLKRRLDQLRGNRLVRHYRKGGKAKPTARLATAGQLQQPQAAKTAPRPALVPPAGPGEARADWGGVTVAGEEQPSAHVAHGIFSLPVELPEGETRLDFARPGGNAELSLLAVPLSLTRGLWGTLAVIIGAAVLLLMAKLFSRFFRGDRNNARVIAYVAVVVLLAVAAGLAGLIAAAFVIGLAEAVRWSFPKYLQKRKHTRTATLRNQ